MIVRTLGGIEKLDAKEKSPCPCKSQLSALALAQVPTTANTASALYRLRLNTYRPALRRINEDLTISGNSKEIFDKTMEEALGDQGLSSEIKELIRMCLNQINQTPDICKDIALRMGIAAAIHGSRVVIGVIREATKSGPGSGFDDIAGAIADLASDFKSAVDGACKRAERCFEILVFVTQYMALKAQSEVSRLLQESGYKLSDLKPPEKDGKDEEEKQKGGISNETILLIGGLAIAALLLLRN